MSKKISVIVIFLLVGFLVGCGGLDDSGQNSSENNLEFNSEAEYNLVVECSGNASGTDFSGIYDFSQGPSTFSGNCPASEVKKADFYVNMTLSESEIEDVIKEGYPESSFTKQVVQKNGVIVFKGAGDDNSDLSGCLNSDGSFTISDPKGFLDADHYWTSLYEGIISNTTMNGEFKARLKFEPDINCLFSSSFSAELSEIYSNYTPIVYSCATDKDCALTLFANAPISEEECKCLYMCSGDVVSAGEAEARVNAYGTFCPDPYSYKAGCPIASCAAGCYAAACEKSVCVKKGLPCQYI